MFTPRYYPIRYFPIRFFPPSGEELTGVADYFYKRKMGIYISKGTSGTADDTNTVLINVEDFSFNRSAITNDVSRDTFDPSQKRIVKTYIEAITPVNFSFVTYMMPITDSGTAQSPEDNLWVGLLGVDGLSQTSAQSLIDFSQGNVQTLQNLTLWFYHPDRGRGNFRLDNAIVDRATIEFNIRGISKITWQGRALGITQDTTPPTYTDRTTETSYIKNKPSTIELNMNSTDYVLALIGGRVTIDNNNKIYGRKKLGQTTVPTGHYTGNRTVKGNLDFYTKSGLSRSANLFNDLLNNAATSTYESNFLADIGINISGTATPNVRINIPQALLSIPQQQYSEVLSLSVGFTAQEDVGAYTTVNYRYSEVLTAPGYNTNVYFAPVYFTEDYFTLSQ